LIAASNLATTLPRAPARSRSAPHLDAILSSTSRQLAARLEYQRAAPLDAKMADATPPPWMQPGAPPTHAKKEAAPPPKDDPIQPPPNVGRPAPAAAPPPPAPALVVDPAPPPPRRKKAAAAKPKKPAARKLAKKPAKKLDRRTKEGRRAAAAAAAAEEGAPPPGTSARAALETGAADGVAADGGDDQLKLPPLSRDIRLVVAHDWEQIVGKPIHWAPLPRKPCVADLLQTYAATKRQGGAHGQAWRDFAGALITYFDAALPRLLLYRQERQQYDLRARGRGAPSRLYGAELCANQNFTARSC